MYICLFFLDVTMRNEADVGNYSGNNQKDEFTDILGPNFNLESMVHESGIKLFQSSKFSP